MHPNKKEGLLKKGWTEQEIKKAEAILEKTELKDIFFSRITFWSAFAVIILANILISLGLILFLVFLNQMAVYFMILILGGTTGFIYNFLIKDIKHLERKHHFWAGIITPLVALVNVAVIVLVSNQLQIRFKIEALPYNPWWLGLLFALAFILPYLISLVRGKHQFYSPKN